MKRLGDWTLNAAIIGTVAYVMLRDGGPVREWWVSRTEQAAAAEFLAEQWSDLAAGGSLVAGSGPADLVEFGDYECPFCRAAQDSLPLLAERPKPLTVRFRHLPLGIHPHSGRAARVAICAEEQDAFERAHRLLFDRESWAAGWELDVARRAGVADEDEFTACLEAPRTTRRLDEDREFARSIRLRGTPAWVGRNGVVPGLAPVKDLAALAN